MLLEQHPATRKHNLQLHTRPTTCKPKRQVPQAATIFITLELLMMGIMVPKHVERTIYFAIKKQSVASSWPFIFHVLDLRFLPRPYFHPKADTVPITNPIT